MPEIFRDDEKGYLLWAARNPDGFIVNTDKAGTDPHYPMVHRATHRIMTSPKIQNYTTASYFKVCSNDMDELERWSERERRKSLSRCGTCM